MYMIMYLYNTLITPYTLIHVYIPFQSRSDMHVQIIIECHKITRISTLYAVEYVWLMFLLCSDVAMLLRDPYALDVLCKTILQCLLQIYEQNKLPRVSLT